MLATKISFMNEIANLAERMGADIEKVRLGIGSDPRIGYSFIYPGAGYGGSCFPFKPNTDDMREAPARDLMEALWAAGAKVRAYDPVAMAEAQRIYGDRPDLALVASAEAALEGADVLAVVTEWQEFRSPDFDYIRDAVKHKVVFDGRNIFDPALVKSFGLTYHGIGRGEPLVV
jgi:UDPglucose 6-dehydrogenase